MSNYFYQNNYGSNYPTGNYSAENNRSNTSQYVTQGRTGWISENFEGGRRRANVSPVNFGPTAIEYPTWKKNKGYPS